MSLTTPSKIRELQSKLYRKAKNEYPVQSRGTDRFSIKAVFGELGVLQLSRAKAEPRS